MEGKRRLVERLAEWDDRSAWDGDLFLWRHDFLALVLCEISAGAMFALASWLIGPVAGAAVFLALTVCSIGAYLFWRRRRNRRLMGDPRRWPS